DGETATLSVEAFETDGRFMNGLDMRATLHAPDTIRQEIRLVQTASGTYEGHFDVGPPGAYLLSILASAGHTTPDYALHVGFHISTGPEDRASHTNLALLNDMVRLTRGAVLTSQDNPFRHRGTATTYLAVWPLTAATALVLFVVEVAVRRGFRLFPRGRKPTSTMENNHDSTGTC